MKPAEPGNYRLSHRGNAMRNRGKTEEEGTVRSSREEKAYRDSVPALLFWYDYNARILPWREDPTPYHIWISEIMLQQTRVEAVRAYYERFLAELPDVRAVAEASEDRLVKLWEGLGYYSRIRNIAKAAKVLCEKYDARLPADYGLLRELPGIGDYTAGAIASIAFGIPVPAVDGNVLRVFARVTGYREDIRSDRFKKHVGEQLRMAISKYAEENREGVSGNCSGGDAGRSELASCAAKVSSAPGHFNQAIMDVGATVCIPNGKPHCDKCPLSHLCAAFSEGLTAEIPAKKAGKARPVEKRTVLLLCDGERVLLHRRPAKGLLAGMWEFPGVSGHMTYAGAKQAAAAILAEASEGVDSGDTSGGGTAESPFSRTELQAKKLPDSRHIFSHTEWDMRGYRIEIPKEAAGRIVRASEKNAPTAATGSAEYLWASAREIREEHGVASAFRVYREHLPKEQK